MRRLYIFIFVIVAIGLLAWWYLSSDRYQPPREAGTLPGPNQVLDKSQSQEEKSGDTEIAQHNPDSIANKIKHQTQQDDSDREPERQPDPFQNSTDIVGLLHDLESNPDVSSDAVLHAKAQWIPLCAQTINIQNSGYVTGFETGLKRRHYEQLSKFCALDKNYTDQELRQLVDESIEHGSLAVATDKLSSLHDEGHDRALEEISRILSESVDEGEIAAALDYARLNGYIPDPFGDIEGNTSYLYDGRITMDVAATILCDKYGGCYGSNHPMVIRRCLESPHGCYRPSDYIAAVEQNLTPIQQVAFWRMLQTARELTSSE